MNGRKKILGLFVLFTLVLAACGNQEATSNEAEADSENEDALRIGSMFSLSGDVSAYGIVQNNALQLAFEEINAEGGVLGKEVQLVEYDIMGSDSEAVSAVTRLGTEENLPLIIGADISSASKAAIQTAAQVEVPVISPSASADNVTVAADGGVEPYGYRVAFQDSDQGRSLAQFANANLEAETAAILGDNSSDHALGLVEMFEEAFKGEVVAYENYQSGENDYSAVLTNLQNVDFDVLFVPGYYEEGGPIIKQAREMGLDQPILGASGFGNEQLKELAGKENLNDVYYTTHFSSLNKDPKVNAFIENYTEKFDTAPDHFAALAYDTAYVVKDAFEKAGTTDSQVVNEALSETENFEGITGTFSFNENHNPVKTVNIIELQEGEEADVHEVNPE